MSKVWKMMSRIRKREIDRELFIQSVEYAREHNIDGLGDVTAPSVDNVENVIKNEQPLTQVLLEIASQCDLVAVKIRTKSTSSDVDDIGRHLRILKATCNTAIAKIETGW